MSPKTTSKGVAWLYSEIGALLDIWADPEIQEQLAGRLHNMCIYDKISKRLSDLGIQRTGEQCREKIKKLRRDYKTVVDNNYSPAFARKVLGCYDKVHEVFGKCTIIRPPFVIESLAYNESNPNTSKNSPNLRKKKRNMNAFTPIDLSAKDLDQSKSSLELQINKQCKQASSRKKSSEEKRKRLKTLSDANKTLETELRLHQTDLLNRILNIQRKQNDEILQHQREHLLKEEQHRREIRKTEIDLFKSVLFLLAEKKGIHLKLQ